MNNCRITILGSSSGMPSPTRFCSSLFFQTEKFNFLLDCGEGTSFSLQRNKINSQLIDSVFITHCHSDHLGGLFLLIQMMHLLNRRRSLRVFLPEEAVSEVKSFLQTCYLFPEKITPHVIIQPITERFKFEENGVIIKAHPNRHLMGNQNVIEEMKYSNKMQSFCFVLNITAKKIVYSGDIESSDDLAEIIDDADLLITECFHAQPDRLLPLMVEKRVKMLVFTHIPPELEEKQDEILFMAKKNGFEKLFMAYDGMVINI
jgi:ribonuclease BN (tRNA processing enzyme)